MSHDARQIPILLAILFALVAVALAANAWADEPAEELDPEVLVLTWHKISGAPFDFDRAVNFSPKMAGAPTFDRPDIIKAEKARIQAIIDAGSKEMEFATTVSDGIGQYDHERGEFPVNLFQPGVYLQYRLHYVDYRLVFANAGIARAIVMPNKEEARAFDQKLLAAGRRVETQVRFRIVGSGDPQGGVGGDRVMRAELITVKLIDRNGQVVYAPDVKPVSETPPAQFAAADIDIAGMRIGVEADELQAALERLYSAKVERVDGARSSMIDKRYAGYLEIDLLTCMGGGYRKRDPRPGDVCVRAYYDEDEVIRTIIVVRVFPWMDYEKVRDAAVARYGTVSATAGGGMALGWGPTVDPKLLSYRVGDGHALTMNVNSPSDFMDQALNSRPKVNVALQLADAEWAAKAKPLR